VITNLTLIILTLTLLILTPLTLLTITLTLTVKIGNTWVYMHVVLLIITGVRVCDAAVISGVRHLET